VLVVEAVEEGGQIAEVLEQAVGFAGLGGAGHQLGELLELPDQRPLLLGLQAFQDRLLG